MSFEANPLYLGVGAKLPLEKAIDWLDMLSYQVDDHIQFIVEEYDLTQLIRTVKISKKPFSDLIYKFIVDKESIAFGPVSLVGKGVIEENIIRNELTKSGKVKEVTEKKLKHLKIEFAFAYDMDTMDYSFDAFCNFTKTDEGGIHVDTIDDVLTKYIQTKAMDSMTENQKENYPVTRQDVRTGMKLVVNLSTNAQVQFMGNAKNKIQNTELVPVIREIVKKEIDNYFSNNTGKLNDVIKIVRENAKARIDLQKMRSVTTKGRSTRFDDLRIESFIPCNNNKPGAYREIYLIEGQKSAGGAMADGRDANVQAIYGFRGQTLNPYKTTFTKFMENEEWKNYIKVLRCGIGASFDLKKCHYNKIIISTDADVDGDGIAIGMASTHALYLPGIITAGMLYRVFPPLYQIRNKETPFLGSKKDLVEIYRKEVVKRYKISIGNDELRSETMWTFLYDIADYQFIITEMIQPFCRVPAKLIETVAAALVLCDGIDVRTSTPKLYPGVLQNQKFIRNFMQMVQKRFPEIVLSNDTIKGVAEGNTVSMQINNRFVTRIEELIKIYLSYGYIIFVRDKKDNEKIPMSILDFCEATYALRPDILHRFKGLGECDAEDLWETVLNPANRIMTRLTFGSIERDMEIFRKLKSNKPSYVRQRVEMVEAYKIRYEDLDN